MQTTQYQLRTPADDGKSATLVETVNTNADSLMGLEIGPDNALYYVDAEKNTVVRIDAWFDTDNDGIKDDVDNCLTVIANIDQADYGLDQVGDACDDDDDSDRVDDVVDTCQFSPSRICFKPRELILIATVVKMLSKMMMTITAGSMIL